MNKQQYISSIEQSISKYGRGIVGVFNNEYDEEVHSHFYSVGCSVKQHQPKEYPNFRPFEYICFHPTEVAAEVIHKVANKINRSKHNLDIGSEYLTEVPGLLTDFHVDGFYLPKEQVVGLRPLRGIQERIVREKYLRTHQWEEFRPYLGGHTLVQVLLSDENNRFAGQEGVNECFLEWTPEFLWV